MKKKLIAMLLTGAMAMSLLSACGGGGGGSGEPANPGSSGDPAKPDDKVYELIVTNHDSGTSVGEAYVETMLNQISEESGGRLKFLFYPGGSLFGGGEAVDAVRSGSADICWNATSITVGVFPVSEFLNVPLNGITCARMGSKVMRDMYNEIPECAAEYEDFYVLELQGNCAAPLSPTQVKIESPADLKGLSIRSAGTVQSNYINMIGAAASSMSTSEVYEALEKNVVNGMTNDWHNIDCFSLYEVVKYVMDYTINTTSCFMLMNKDKYNSLPEDLQQLLDKYNDYASDMAGWYWDSCRFSTAYKMGEFGVEIYEPSEEVRAYLESDEFRQEMADWYIKYLNDKGLDGQKIYDKCMEIVARYADEYADPYGTPITVDDWDQSSVNNYQ